MITLTKTINKLPKNPLLKTNKGEHRFEMNIKTRTGDHQQTFPQGPPFLHFLGEGGGVAFFVVLHTLRTRARHPGGGVGVGRGGRVVAFSAVLHIHSSGARRRWGWVGVGGAGGGGGVVLCWVVTHTRMS